MCVCVWCVCLEWVINSCLALVERVSLEMANQPWQEPKHASIEFSKEVEERRRRRRRKEGKMMRMRTRRTGRMRSRWRRCNSWQSASSIYNIVCRQIYASHARWSWMFVQLLITCQSISILFVATKEIDIRSVCGVYTESWSSITSIILSCHCYYGDHYRHNLFLFSLLNGLKTLIKTIPRSL